MYASDSVYWTAPADERIAEYGEGFTETYGEWRLRQWREDADSHVAAWKASDIYAQRPFRFEDLAGREEPAKWGPVYPKTASASVEKWRSIARGRELSDDERREYGRAVGVWIRGLNRPKRAPCTLSTRTNAPSGQTGEFDAAKHRAKIRAESEAVVRAARARVSDKAIVEAYKVAMREKRAREAAQLAPEAAPMPAKAKAHLRKLLARKAARELAEAA